MKFIFDNFGKVRNTENVLMIKPYKTEGKLFMGALITNGEGVYEMVPLSVPEGCFTFPWEPIDEISGFINLQDFIKDHSCAFNKNHLKGFIYTDMYSSDNKKKVAVFAEFKDGSNALLLRQPRKVFFKETMFHLYDLLYYPQYKTPEEINEHYINVSTLKNNIDFEISK